MEIAHKYQPELVCPHCGHKHSDSWDLSADDGTYECESCEEEFTYERIVTIEYSTSKNSDD